MLGVSEIKRTRIKKLIKKQIIMWKITDNNGTIYSGNKDEMLLLYQQIIDGKIEEKWTGDLLLIQVHSIYN